MNSIALALDLPSLMKTAVSAIVDAMGVETQTSRDSAKSTTQEPPTLPPKVWALLLIADGAKWQPSFTVRPITPAVWEQMMSHMPEIRTSLGDDYDDYGVYDEDDEDDEDG